MGKHSKRDLSPKSDGEDLYAALGLKPDASADDIKKAYRVLALKWHPDRACNSGTSEATIKFQEISRAYGILSDPARRKVYDQTGSIDTLVGAEGEEWLNYWRALYPKITIKDIQDFEKKYKGSDEELADLKSAYLQHKGDMDAIMETVILAEPKDEDRFRELINEAIENGELKQFKKFSDEPPVRRAKRQKNAEKEAKEAEELAQELGIAGKSDDQLRDIIVSRSRNNFENMMASLEAKYSKPAKTSSKAQSKRG